MTMDAYRTRLVLTVADQRWVKDADLPIAPSPGLGLRVDTYDVLNVAAVSVDASGGGVECVVVEDEPAAGLTEKQCLFFGFRVEPEADASEATDHETVPAVLVVVDAELGTWQKSLTLPFPPFAGLRVRLDSGSGSDSGSAASVFSIVVGDRHGPVTCLATFDDAHRPASDAGCEALGLEESIYP